MVSCIKKRNSRLNSLIALVISAENSPMETVVSLYHNALLNPTLFLSFVSSYAFGADDSFSGL